MLFFHGFLVGFGDLRIHPKVAHGDQVRNLPFQLPGAKNVLAAGTWVWHLFGHDLIGLKIERVAENQLVGFASPKLSHLDELAVQSGIGRNDHRLLVRDSFDQPEGRRDNVHFPIADQDVAVATETFDALVLMRIFGNFSKMSGRMAWQLVECGHAIDSARDS